MKLFDLLIETTLYYIVFMSLLYCVNTEEPALKVNLNPPEENTKDTINAIKDLAKLEDDLRIGANEDFDEEKKKMIEIQKTRIHDIVHGAFLGLNSLIPNPIKASIRKAIRDHIGGKSSEEQIADPSKSISAVETDKTKTDIRKQQDKIRKIDEPKFRETNSLISFGNKNNYLRNSDYLKNVKNLYHSENYDYIDNENESIDMRVIRKPF